ncbi:hypothetical protein [Synechococcus sp. BO 8801]|uniref:hypothetical protein n=1 Tax=Synechococcus sp. BO 8801 TaxID=169670 RepID=UPI000B98569B|nr:hypothetical protein [Synechococcus sp. BO 8801]
MTDLDAFLRWNSGHLLENRTRGAYAEWLVHRALGFDPGQHRVEWAEVDVTFSSITLEVKSAAFVQSWQQARPSTISFPIEPRAATGYVFCLLAEQDPSLVNPQDLSQWLFWVVPTAKLHRDRRSIGLQALIRTYGDGLRFEELANRIEALRPALPEGSRAAAEMDLPC